MQRSERITAAERQLAEAKNAYSAAIESTQAECKHPLILERRSGVTGYRYIENRWFPAVRVCVCCGYVEEAQHGWPAHETTDTPLYNTKPRSRTILNRADFEVNEEKLNAALVRRAD